MSSLSRHTSSGMDISSSGMSNAPTTGGGATSSSTAATQSLQLLLRDDYLLTQHELHITKNSEEAAFQYAASLLQQDNNGQQVQQRATDALQEVARKLVLVQSLAERVSRTSPKAVAGPLLRLHGYALHDEEGVEQTTITEEEADLMDASASSMKSNSATTTTLVATRDRCHRLQRQSEVLEGVAKRVETSLTRGLTKMETATARLSRVLALSSTLKMILRLQFEASKLQGYDLDDLRDLTRAAASVAIVEDLLDRLHTAGGSEQPHVVLQMKPAAQATASRVRAAAKTLLEQHQEQLQSGASSGVVQLGATLQVYYHLGELPQAAWSAVQFGLDGAHAACDTFWSPQAISSLVDEATATAKASSKTESALQRNLSKVLRQRRRDASSVWATSVAQASLQVWNLHRVLCRKTDPVSRQVFVSVVAQAAVPPSFAINNTASAASAKDFSVFTIFWDKLCEDLGERLLELLQMEKLSSDVAALYPAIRAAVLGMLGRLYDTMQAGASSSSSSLEDASSTSYGVLGGSSALDSAFWTPESASTNGKAEQETSASLGVSSADTWTRADVVQEESADQSFLTSAGSTTSLSSIFSSLEWKSMQSTGLQPLQTAFLESCRRRLCSPIQFMFPEGLAVDEDGVAMQVLPTLPSRYDMQKMDHTIRSELSLADPREGGGDLSMTTMIAEVVVDMVERFCARAKTAVSEAGEDGCLSEDGTPTEAHLHDLKVATVMSTLATALKNAPENTFVVPYRPATSAQHEEAANLCQQALVPALQEIEKMVKSMILTPLCSALNRRVSAAIAKMHHGTYLESSLEGGSEGPSFVQKHLVGLYEDIAERHLSKLPADYAGIVASTIASFSIYTFVSNASLIRPLGETARLHITQDLADFELALESLVLKGTMTLSQVEFGKPYAELRAVRQMFYWTGLENKSLAASSVAKSMLREVWVKDVRPSTVFHFLFSFAPDLLSSPHHSKRMRPQDYVSTLVKLDGSIDDGEASAWMTTMACCDSYQQRESVVGMEGDRRIAAILMMLGPELLRRRRH
jgi:hypothetical protein